MDGILYILNLMGQSLQAALTEGQALRQRVAELEAEVAKSQVPSADGEGQAPPGS